MSGLQASGKCWHCGESLATTDYQRESTCPRCRKYTHVCRNCRFYAQGRPNDCLEPIAEPVADKERANFCGYFEPSPDGPSGETGSSQEELLKAAQDLFK